MRISLIFFLLGGGGLLLSFTLAQAQDDDCPICAIGNFVEFLGEQVTDAIISGASALKGAFEAAPAGDDNIIDPFDAFLDERQPPPPPPQLSPQQNADPVEDADIELLNLAPSIPPTQEKNIRCDPQRTSVCRSYFNFTGMERKNPLGSGKKSFSIG